MFKIKKVAWTWPDAVKSKEVYRDKEYIVSSTKEEALAAMKYLLNKPQGLTYSVTVHVDGEYQTHYLYNMPCLGGWVKYKDTHGEKYSMNPYFPRDIRVAFPEGDVVYVGLNTPNASLIHNNPYYQFILSDESPWISGFNSKDNLIIGENYIILTDMNTDPTVWFSLLRHGGLKDGLYRPPGSVTDPRSMLLVNFLSRADLRRLAGQKPLKISGGTWAEGYGYTRPYNDCIFYTKLPCSFNEFKSLPSASPLYSPPFKGIEASRNVILDKFDVDIYKACEEDTAALVDAWYFFKDAAKALED